MMGECFVVMPYGRKKYEAVADVGEEPSAEIAEQPAMIHQALIDFDNIYENIIQAAVNGHFGLECKRSDETRESGLIHREMIRSIIEADVVIVDITLNNPNVFYELAFATAYGARRQSSFAMHVCRWPIPSTSRACGQ